VAIANALQLEAARTTPALSRFNYDTKPSLKSLNLSISLTFDLEHLHCDVMKLCIKFERDRSIRGGVIAILVFDLMTLNTALRVALGCGIIFTKFDLRQLIRS